MAKTKKTFDWSGKSYPKYNPAEAGHGNPSQWKSSFNKVMGWDEAVSVVGNDSPWTILGIAIGSSKDTIKRAYRKLVQQYHPDKFEHIKISDPLQYSEAEKMFKRINASYIVCMGRS